MPALKVYATMPRWFAFTKYQRGGWCGLANAWVQKGTPTLSALLPQDILRRNCYFYVVPGGDMQPGVCVKAIGWLWIASPISFHLISPDRVFGRTWSSAIRLYWLARKPWGPSVSASQPLGLQVCNPTLGFFRWALGIRTQVLILVSRALYPLSTPNWWYT